MAKHPTIVEEIPNQTEEILNSIPPETILTVEENVEDPTETTITSIPNTISLSPRDVIDQKAKEAREARRIPAIPGYAPSLEQFQEWSKLLDDNMWSHVSVYLYRAWPKIVRQLSDPENKTYIDMICKEHVDKGLINYMQDTHGGGTYKIMVLDLDQKSPKGDSKCIMQFTFRIDSTEYPPILNLKEIDVNHKPNMGFINQMVSKGLMDTKGNVMQPSNGNGNTGNPAELAGEIGKMYTKVLDMYSKMGTDQQATINKMISEGASKKDDGGISQLLLEKLKQDDPNKNTATMIAMMTAMKDMQPKQDTGIFQLLITQMQQSAERQMEMMKMMFTQQQNQQQPVQQEDFIDKLVKYRTALPELFSSGGNHREPKKETAEIIIDAAKEFGLPVIGLVSQYLQMSKGVAPIVPVTEGQAREMAAGVGAQPSPQAQQQQRVLTMPNPNPPSTPVTPNPGEPAKDVVTGQPVLDPNNLTVCQQLLIQYGGMLIHAISSGMDGAQLADSLEGAKGLFGDIYGKLKAQGGEEILKAMESIPEFWNQTGKVYGREHMEQLVSDFLLDPPDDDDEETGAGAPVVQ